MDNSNVFIGAQLGQGVDGTQDLGIRIIVRELVKVLEQTRNGREIKTRIVSGSTPPATGRVWTEWRNCHYTVHLGNRDAQNRVRY